MSKAYKFLISMAAFICVNAMIWISFWVGGGELFTYGAGWASFSGLFIGGVIFAACMDCIE